MPEETPEIIAERSKISFLSHWKSPKYSLGQQMKQGQIVGIEYHPAGTFRASRFGERWTYWVLIHDHDIDVESFQEQSLEPMSEEDLLLEIESIKANVTSQEKNLSALVEQLREDG